jgi:hypothetical protein
MIDCDEDLDTLLTALSMWRSTITWFRRAAGRG